jgi:hypothetical protein
MIDRDWEGPGPVMRNDRKHRVSDGGEAGREAHPGTSIAPGR